MKNLANGKYQNTVLTKPSAITCVLAFVWLVNGLYCKIFHRVPRHQQIVERIMGNNYAEQITILIGVGEVGLAIWIISGRLSRLVAITQMILIALMNVIEFFIAPDLLLFGKLNILVASLFIGIIYYNEWRIIKKQNF